MAVNARALRTGSTLRGLRVARVARRPRKLPRQAFPLVIERAYRDQLRRIAAQTLVALQPLFDELPGLLESAAADRDLNDRADVGEGKRVDEILARLGDRLTVRVEAAEALAQAFATQVSTFNRVQLGKQLRAGLGADPFIDDANLRTQLVNFTSENVSLIRDIPVQIRQRIEGIVKRGIADATPHSQLAPLIRAETGIAYRRAKLIARDQIGKLNGNINRARQKSLGIESYIWRTANDERVRVRPISHRAREGRVYRWDDPPSDGHPGQPINCRCYPEPVLDPILAAAEPAVAPVAPPAAPVAVAAAVRPRPVRQRRPRTVRAQVPPTPVIAPAIVPSLPPPTVPPAGAITASMHPRARFSAGASPNSIKAREAAEDKLREITGGKININAMTHLWAPPEGYRLQMEGVGPSGDGVILSGKLMKGNTEIGRITRYIKRDNDGKLFAYHGYLVMEDEFQGTGVAGYIVDNAIKQYAGLGIDYVKLDAHWVGRYTWARRGFEPYEQDVRSEIRDGLQRYLKRRKMPAEMQQQYLDKFDNSTLQEVSNWDDGVMHPNEYEERKPDDPKEFKLGKAFMLSPQMPTWTGKKTLKK